MADVIVGGVHSTWLIGTSGSGDMTATGDFGGVVSSSHREFRGGNRKRPVLDIVNGNDPNLNCNSEETKLSDGWLGGSDAENQNFFSSIQHTNELNTPTTSSDEKFNWNMRSRTLPTERALKSAGLQRHADQLPVPARKLQLRLDGDGPVPAECLRDRNDFVWPGTSCAALKSAVYALYRLEDFQMSKIGQGFFSEVYKVTHKSTEEVMVLKMNTIRSNRANVRREIELMATTFNHTNVVKFKGVCVDSGLLHALTEYCEGGSLDQLVKDEQQPLEWPTRLSLSLDIARGMEYVSRTHIHRDLTSKNVLIRIGTEGRIGDRSDRLTAVIADFGLAIKIPPKEVGDESTKRKLPTAGTPYWMAPECLNEEYYDERSDVFSFGIILCEIIARVDADPDMLPRTPNFGLDYNRFWELVPIDVHEDFLKLAFQCCRMNPDSRPTFTDSLNQLAKLQQIIANERDRDFSFNKFPLRKSHSDAGPIHNGGSSLRNTIQLLKLVTSATVSPQQNGSSTVFLSRRLGVGDPGYQPGEEFCNPFKQHANYRDGKKIFSQIDINGTSPTAVTSRQFISSPTKDDRRTRSLPTSPLVAHRMSSCSAASQVPSPIQELPLNSLFDSSGSLSDKFSGDVVQLALTDANMLGVKSNGWGNSNSPRSKSPAVGRKLTAEFIASDFEFIQSRKNRASCDDPFDGSSDHSSSTADIEESTTLAAEQKRLGGVRNDLNVIRTILAESTCPSARNEGAAELISPPMYDVDLTNVCSNGGTFTPASVDRSPVESVVTLTSSNLGDSKTDTIVVDSNNAEVSNVKYCGDRVRDRCEIL